MGGNVVLGGVASAWGDNVDTSNGAVGLLYPRALAVGEKLWSPAAATALFNPRDGAAMLAVENRMALARCVLVQVRVMHARCAQSLDTAPPRHSWALASSPRSFFQRGQSVAPVAQAGIHGVCWRPQWNRGASGGGGGGSSTSAGTGRVELTDGALAAALVATALGGAVAALLSAALAQRFGCRLPVRSKASTGDAPLLPAVQRKQSRLAPSDETVF